jgi:uncharacterized protein with NRDE domain
VRGRVPIIRRVCTLAVYFQTSSQFPVVIAANRDEFYSRPAKAPARLASDPWVVAGEDLIAGGTWLGLNAYGVVAGLLNRRTPAAPDPTRRSRGLLCLDALRYGSVEAAATHVCREPADRYNPFNLLLASRDDACVVGNVSGEMVRTPLVAGLHLLTNLDVNDFECPRIAKSYRLFDAQRRSLDVGTSEEILAGLRRILSDHSTLLDPRSDGPPNNLCVHTEHFGTRSSSVLLYSARSRRFSLWYADGAPCETDYVQIPLPPPGLAPAKTAGQA